MGCKEAGPLLSLHLNFLLEGTLHHRPGEPRWQNCQHLPEEKGFRRFFRVGVYGHPGEPPEKDSLPGSPPNFASWRSPLSLPGISLSKETTVIINPPELVHGMKCTQHGGQAKFGGCDQVIHSLQIEQIFTHSSYW